MKPKCTGNELTCGRTWCWPKGCEEKRLGASPDGDRAGGAPPLSPQAVSTEGAHPLRDLQEARGLLAAAYDRRGFPWFAKDIRSGDGKQFDVAVSVIANLLEERS